MEVKGYSKTNNYCVLDSTGQNATKVLLELLFRKSLTEDKTVEIDYDYNSTKSMQKFTIEDAAYRYEFKNVPIQWDGTLDLYKLKEMEVN